MLKWIVGTIFGVVLGLAIYFSMYLGAFKAVALEETRHGSFLILSLEHIGAYHKITPTIEQVEKWARSQGLPCPRSFSQFFDDPRKVEEGRLRSRGGCIWGEELGASKPDPATFSKTLPEGFTLSEIPQGSALKAVFEGSPAIGPIKVYSKVEEYFSQKPLTRGDYVVEVYNIKSPTEMTTTYYFPFQ